MSVLMAFKARQTRGLKTRRECGWNFYCVPEHLNTAKSINYMKVNPPVKRVKNNVVLFGNTYFCNSFNINSPGKCTSGGWKSGSER